MATKDELRRQLNLKNLQRHDPSIDRIVASTSYASIYDNKGHGWVKTGVEGPMFLFSRTTAPHYGFFVLNRNGLEYVQEFLTPESEVQVGGEFILYESGKDADRATGIWVFEEKERHELCRQMEQVRARAASSEGAKATAPGLPRGKPISVDMLFSAASPSPAAATLPAAQQPHQAAPPPQTAATAMNPLDALFASATMSPRPAPAAQPPTMLSPVPQSAAVGSANPQTQTHSQRLPATLEQLFAAASPTPQPARLPSQQQAQSPPSVASPGSGGGGGMALLDSIFAAAAETSSPRPAAMRAPAPATAAAAAAAPPYNTTPYSPQMQVPAAASSRPAPLPTSPPLPPHQQRQQQAAPPPRDARDLLAMLGGIGSSSTSGSASSPHAAAGASNGTMATAASEPGRSSPVDLATKPHTTVHPQGFSMDVQPGTIAPDLVTSTLPTPVPEEEEVSPTLPGRGGGPTPPPKSKEEEKSRATPMFAPPVLSHDIFASLPFPGGSGGGKAAVKEEPPMRRHDGLTDSTLTSSSAPAQRPDLRTETQSQPDSSVPAPTKVKAVEEEAETAPPDSMGARSSSSSSSRTGGPQQQQQQQQQQQRQAPGSSLLIDKAELVSRVDGILTKTGVGMTAQAANANGANSNPDGPLSKEEFVAEALKVVQKPSFLMQLYGRYLERYEEANE